MGQVIDLSFAAALRNSPAAFQTPRRNAGNTAYEIATGVWTDQSYSDPAWITALANAKVTGLGSLALLSAAPAGTLTGTTLASNVVTSSLTTIGTLVGGSIPYSLLTGTPTVPTAANPTATIGTTAVPGVAATFLRSDGSPAFGNLTGHITSTGMVTVLGSFTSAQLATALTDETGTGANVFAGSPTFTGTVAAAALTATGQVTNSLNGAASTPPLAITGTWFSGGSTTTTKPQFLIEPAGTTSTGWSTSGTGLGINAASGFAGNLLDLQVAAVQKVSITAGGVATIKGTGSTVLANFDGVVLSVEPTTQNTYAGIILRTLGGGGNKGIAGFAAQNVNSFDAELCFFTDNQSGAVERMRISRFGYVGINKTSGFTSQFEVDSSGAAIVCQVNKAAASRSVPIINLQTSAAGSLGNVSGGCFADVIATTSTTSTDGTFDTLKTITFVANSLIANGDKHYFDFTLTVVGHAITTTDVKVAFGGITIFDSGALALGTGTSTIRLTGYITRVSSTTCISSVSWQASGGASIALASADIQTFTGTGTLTGMTLTGTNNLVLSAASASTNAASGDISVVHGTAGVIGFGS